jgi:hypothetical protein
MIEDQSPEEKATHDFVALMQVEGLVDEAVTIFHREMNSPGLFRRHVFGDK